MLRIAPKPIDGEANKPRKRTMQEEVDVCHIAIFRGSVLVHTHLDLIVVIWADDVETVLSVCASLLSFRIDGKDIYSSPQVVLHFNETFDPAGTHSLLLVLE